MVQILPQEFLGGGLDRIEGLLTFSNHKNVAAVAILKQLSCIVLSKQIQASEEMLNLCSENNIAVFQSSEDSFTTAILLYELLK